MSTSTKESAQTPELGRFSPLRAWMRVQRYAQNNPRRYGFRVGLAAGAFGAAMMLLACLPAIIASGDPWSFWPIYLIALILLLVSPVLMSLVAPRFLRWLTERGSVVPEGADPSKQWYAQRQLRKGYLSGDPETDHLGRRLSSQFSRANSPRFLVVAIVLNAVPVVTLLALDLMAVGAPRVFTLLLIALIVVVWAIAAPLALRQRRRTRTFRELYDAQYGAPDEERSAH